MLDARSRACTGAMAGIYRRLLDRIRMNPESVLHGRVSLSSGQKAAVAAMALAGGGVSGGNPPRLVVVGGGLAGISAALACADAGARRHFVRKGPVSGGLLGRFRTTG